MNSKNKKYYIIISALRRHRWEDYYSKNKNEFTDTKGENGKQRG